MILCLYGVESCATNITCLVVLELRDGLVDEDGVR